MRQSSTESSITTSPEDSIDRAAARHLAYAAERTQALEEEIERLKADLAAPSRELEVLRNRMRQIDESVVWQALQAARSRMYGPAGRDSPRARAIGAALRGGWRLVHRSSGPGRTPPLAGQAHEAATVTGHARLPIAEIPAFPDPIVSMILPVHSQPEYTATCVRAIAATATMPYELIVVDDTATAAVKDVVAGISGARILVNEENLGYTGSLRRGADEARGRYMVLMNDDVVPQAGWLEAMVGCAESAPDIGVVVPLYLDPSGAMKEAGSIIWRDGSAENFGRGEGNLNRSRYRYRRDVDYGSGACLLIRTAAYDAAGGLDEQFSPAYYEDVDLCFSAREAGHRVVFEPRAQVVHVEGATAGTDVTSGTKRFQVVNRDVFIRKWGHRLDRQPAPGTEPRIACRHRPGPQVLIVDERVPTPDRDGGSYRMWGLIEAFQEAGCVVTLLPLDAVGAEPYASTLEERGVEVLRSPLDADLELEALGPALDLAVLSRPLVAARFVYRLRLQAPAARLVYDTVDLHYAREARRAAIEGIPATKPISALRELELAMVRSCDTTLAVTEEEARELREAVPDADVRVLPVGQEPLPGPSSPDGRAGLIFLGNFAHEPNADAARFLVERVMPRVWAQEHDARVTLVGADPPPELQALVGPRVEVSGWLEDLAPTLAAARVAVAPTRYGAGLKIKNVVAMAHRVPVVTTGLGAAGLGSGEHLLVADEPDEIARLIVALLRDDALWQRTSEAAGSYVQENFSRRVMAQRAHSLLLAEASDGAGLEPGAASGSGSEQTIASGGLRAHE